MTWLLHKKETLLSIVCDGGRVSMLEGPSTSFSIWSWSHPMYPSILDQFQEWIRGVKRGLSNNACGFFLPGKLLSGFLCGPTSRTYIRDGAKENLLNFFLYFGTIIHTWSWQKRSAPKSIRNRDKKVAFFSSHVFWDRIGCETLGLGWGVGVGWGGVGI